MCYSGQCPFEHAYFGTCEVVPKECPNRAYNTNDEVMNEVAADKEKLSTEDIQALKDILLPVRKCSNCIFTKACDVLADNYKKDICQLLENMEG